MGADRLKEIFDHLYDEARYAMQEYRDARGFSDLEEATSDLADAVERAERAVRKHITEEHSNDD